MMSLFGLTSAGPDVDILLRGIEQRAHVDIRLDKDRKEKFPLYADGESVAGKVVLRLKDGRRIEHNGVKVEFVGRIEFENGNPYEFVCLVHELAVPGDLRYSTTFDFDFKNVEKQFECYQGNIVRLRYFVRVKVLKRLVDITKEKDLWVYSYRPPPEINNAIRMEVGIEQSLHIEFEYNKSRYHLKDVIVGKIYFLLVRIKIKHMELSIIKRETVGSGRDQQNDQSTVTTYELMDGAPVKGETIPIRLFLSGFDLTPTFRDVNKKYSVRYYINLVLVDEERRRYYKQQEITLLRRPEDAPLVLQDGSVVAATQPSTRANEPQYKGLATSPARKKSTSKNHPSQKQQQEQQQQQQQQQQDGHAGPPPPIGSSDSLADAPNDEEGEKPLPRRSLTFDEPTTIASSAHTDEGENDLSANDGDDDDEATWQPDVTQKKEKQLPSTHHALPPEAQAWSSETDDAVPFDQASGGTPPVAPPPGDGSAFATVPAWLEESPWASAAEPTTASRYGDDSKRDVL